MLYVTCHKVTQLISGRYRIGNQISIHFEYITRTSHLIWKLVCWNESRGRFICVYIDLTSLHEASTSVAGNVTKNAISSNLISGLYILIVWGVDIILELPQRDPLLPGRRGYLHKPRQWKLSPARPDQPVSQPESGSDCTADICISYKSQRPNLARDTKTQTRKQQISPAPLWFFHLSVRNVSA